MKNIFKFGFGVLGLSVLFYILAQTYFNFEAKKLLSKDGNDLNSPVYTVSLSSLKLDGVAAEGKMFEYKGIGFITPEYLNMTSSGSTNEKNLKLSDESAGKLLVATYHENLEGFEDDFQKRKEIFSVSSDDLSFFDSKSELVKKYEKLALKSIYLAVGGEKYLSYFEEGSIKGFQYCKPGLCDNVLVELFYPEPGNGTFILIFKNFNQTEINSVLKSSKFNLNEETKVY